MDLLEKPRKVIGGNIEDSLKVQGSSGSELESSHGLPQRKYTEKTNEGASGVDSMTEKSHVGDVQVQSLVRNVITESSNCNLKSSEMHNQYIMVDDVNEQSSEDPGKSSSAICSLRGGSGLSGESGQPSSNQSIQQGLGINRLKSKTLFEDAETEIFQNSNSPKGEVLHESDNAMSLTADKDATMPIKKSGNDVKQDAPVIKPPLNVVPFSDEWLAAIEAAGEDILTRKTGAVQNSPPDKSIPEPNPWSPVKRKNIEVGPFDCTKYTNVQPSNSH
ncbi:hypothetical protein L1049_012914 [Liquidambar formosana]|uniref:Uncharacterized protein n=1 Tax=Liquidambar formosana TaxID=63359 RepID=A0AAP0WWJ7_LIQFO